MGLKVGIDFGTSNSGVAIYRNGRIELLPIDRQNVVPEVVKTILYITRDYKVAIGQEAAEHYYKDNVNRRRHFVKKWVGEIDFHGGDMFYVRDIYVYVDELQPGRLLQFIKTGLRSPHYDGTQIFDRYYRLSEIIQVYLKELKQRAEKILDEPITSVTLGRPVKFFDDAEKDRKSENILKEAALSAGFEQVDFEFEPVAAAYYYEKSLTLPQNVLIFDFGGGTLDITIMRLGDPGQRKVYATGGIGIAGSDFDRAIIQKRMLAHFGKGEPDLGVEINDLIDSLTDWMVIPDLSTPHARLILEQAVLHRRAPVQMRMFESLIFNDLAFAFYNTVELTKIALSDLGASVLAFSGKDIELWELYTRHQFELDILDYQEQIRAVLINAINASGLEPGQIDAVVKTGGSSNIPIFTQMLVKLFGKDKIKESDAFNSVTAGLAIKASLET